MIYQDILKPHVIAEVGCNHKGEMNIAHELIRTASQFCNVDTVKFQKRTPKELTNEEYNSPHPNMINSYSMESTENIWNLI